MDKLIWFDQDGTEYDVYIYISEQQEFGEFHVS